MELTKGMRIKQTKINNDPLFKNTAANGVLVFEVTRVNPKTYTLKCVEGYLKGSGCKLMKNFTPKSVDIYGTTTEYEIVG